MSDARSRIDGLVRVTDRPAGSPGRSYLVHGGVECDGYSELKALVAEYIHSAERSDEIPIAGRVRRILAPEAAW